MVPSIRLHQDLGFLVLNKQVCVYFLFFLFLFLYIAKLASGGFELIQRAYGSDSSHIWIGMIARLIVIDRFWVSMLSFRRFVSRNPEKCFIKTVYDISRKFPLHFIFENSFSRFRNIQLFIHFKYSFQIRGELSEQPWSAQQRYRTV